MPWNLAVNTALHPSFYIQLFKCVILCLTTFVAVDVVSVVEIEANVLPMQASALPLSYIPHPLTISFLDFKLLL